MKLVFEGGENKQAWSLQQVKKYKFLNYELLTILVKLAKINFKKSYPGKWEMDTFATLLAAE